MDDCNITTSKVFFSAVRIAIYSRSCSNHHQDDSPRDVQGEEGGQTLTERPAGSWKGGRVGGGDRPAVPPFRML